MVRDIGIFKEIGTRIMKSLKELYRIGKGPSSSHTMGPNKAAKDFAERHLDAASFEVTLYGSLAATGKGHMTDVAIIEVLERIAPVSIVCMRLILPRVVSAVNALYGGAASAAQK